MSKSGIILSKMSKSGVILSKMSKFGVNMFRIRGNSDIIIKYKLIRTNFVINIHIRGNFITRGNYVKGLFCFTGAFM